LNFVKGKGTVMKKINIIVSVSVFVVFCTAALSMGADIAKIGVVDFQRAITISSAGKAVQLAIKKQHSKMREDLKKKEDEIKQIEERLRQESMVLSESKREEKKRDLRIKVNDIKVLEKKYNAKLQSFQNDLVKEIQKELVVLVRGIGKRESYLLVIEKVTVIYAPNTIDITDQVIKEYNEVYAKKIKDMRTKEKSK
jgi:outer membrane protein